MRQRALKGAGIMWWEYCLVNHRALCRYLGWHGDMCLPKLVLNGMHICGTSSSVQSNQWTFLGNFLPAFKSHQPSPFTTTPKPLTWVASMKTGGACAKNVCV